MVANVTTVTNGYHGNQCYHSYKWLPWLQMTTMVTSATMVTKWSCASGTRNSFCGHFLTYKHLDSVFATETRMQNRLLISADYSADRPASDQEQEFLLSCM